MHSLYQYSAQVDLGRSTIITIINLEHVWMFKDGFHEREEKTTLFNPLFEVNLVPPKENIWFRFMLNYLVMGN